MAIEHSMDRAFGRQWDVGEAAHQPLADFASTPAGMFVLHIQNVILHLKGKLVSVAIGTPASVGQPLHPAFLITIEDLVAGLARNAELPAQIRHRLPSQSPSHELNSFIHDRTLLPRHPLSSPTKRGKCNLCVRYDLLPMCRVVHSNTCEIAGSSRTSKRTYIRVAGTGCVKNSRHTVAAAMLT